MNKEEAIEAMKSGEKLTHPSFTKTEWISMKGNDIITEEGYTISLDEFWYYRIGEYFETNWYVWQKDFELI